MASPSDALPVQKKLISESNNDRPRNIGVTRRTAQDGLLLYYY